MIFVFLYKYVSCAVDKTVDTGYTTSTDCNTIHIYAYNSNSNNNSNNNNNNNK